MKHQREAEKLISNIQTLLADLKSCAIRRDIQWGRRIHLKAVESRHDSNLYVVTALIRMYAKCGSMVNAHHMFDSIPKPDVVCWTALLLGYAQNGDGLVSLELFSRMKACGCAPDSVTYIAALKACTSLAGKLEQGEWLKRGREIHSQIGCVSDIFVQSTLIDMYGKGGSLDDALRVFQSIRNPNAVCWNALLQGYAENGYGITTLELFSMMKASGCEPDSVTYISVLKACTSLGKRNIGGQAENLKRGREIHSEIGSKLSASLQNTLIDMYANCSSMKDARHVFDNIQKPCVVSWTALLSGYAENGDGLTTLNLFTKMKAGGCVPNSVTYVAALKACTLLAGKHDGDGQSVCLERGRQIHSEIGSNLNIFVLNTLIVMYAKCSSMGDARRVFDSIQKPDVVSWNSLLLGYVDNGDGFSTLESFASMKTCGCAPNSITYVAAVKACTSLAGKQNGSEYLKRGREIHSATGCSLNIFVRNALIDMYAKYSSMEDARRVFDSIQMPDVVSWNALLLGYVENGDELATLELFSQMKASGCSPNSITYLSAFKACTYLTGKQVQGEWLKRGKEIHSEIRIDLDIFLQNTLIDMYTKSGAMVDARLVFDTIQKPSVVSWNALLLGYADNGEGLTVLDLFSKMKVLQCAPDSVTYVAVFKACGLIGALALGRKFHSDISEFTHHVVTCLVDFYAKCGSVVEACEVFDIHSSARAVSTWNALLAGYGSFGEIGSVFNLFEAMQDQGFQPDSVTFVCMLSCCSHAGLVGKAKEYFKAMSMQYGITPTVIHYTCMVDVLGRANQLNEAIAVLQEMPCNPDVVTWMTLLGACRKWKNLEIGRRAFQSLVNLDKKNASAYVLMADIYGSRGMWEEQERVQETRTKLAGWKFSSEQAYVYDELGNVVKFLVGEEDPPEVKNKLKKLIEEIKESAYAVDSDCVRHGQKEEEFCGHRERAAAAYVILKTPPGEVVRVFKNMRMCDDCHGLIKMISKLCGRIIMVSDPSKYHAMVNGSCSCGDCW